MKTKRTGIKQKKKHIMNNNKKMVSSSTLRSFLLVTLIHIEERKDVTKDIIKGRIINLFQCKSIIIATENHEEKGKHYHVGIWANDASKNTLRSQIRKTFPEWEGRAIDVSVHKGWGSICKYTLKEDKEPEVWGELTLEQIKEFEKAQKDHKEAKASVDHSLILKRLEQIEDWYHVYRDEILKNKVLNALPRMKEAFEDLKILKDIETSVFERIIDYLKEKGEVKEYDVEEIKEKYLVIDWIACQLCFRRPIKTKQLFIYGEPSTQKTLLIHFLSKVLRVYFASARRNDFAGANDHYDMWVFDEYHEHTEISDQGGERIGSTMEGSSFVNNLLKVLDGQECRLDSKYSKVFKKKRNVPIIMIANKLPQIMASHGPFRARFYRIRFSSNIEQLEEERIVATLYGCMVRRISKSPYLDDSIPRDVPLQYNNCKAVIVPIEEDKEALIEKAKKWREALSIIENPVRERKHREELEFLKESKAILLSNKGRIYGIKGSTVKIEKGYRIFVWEIATIQGGKYQNWGEATKEIALLDFASIPIKRKSGEKEEGEKEKAWKLIFGEESETEITEEEEEGEEEPYEKRGGIKNIFLDQIERRYFRRVRAYDDQPDNEEVWSVISVQRSKSNHGSDYVSWPLEIKVKVNGKTKVFPAFCKNGEAPEQGEMEKYKGTMEAVEEILKEKKLSVLKCEVSLARNGEKQRWNLEC